MIRIALVPMSMWNAIGEAAAASHIRRPGIEAPAAAQSRGSAPEPAGPLGFAYRDTRHGERT